MNWHLDAALVAQYSVGDLVGARAASVEAHLLACATCRAQLATVAPGEHLASLWAEIEERVDTPRQTWLERLLTALGATEEDARLLGAAPSLQLPWLVSLAAVLAFAAAATHGGERGVLLFLVVAPLAPVAAVAGAYGRGIDPTYEITRSTPYPQYRLLMLRVSAVLVTSLLLTAAVAMTVSASWVASAWLLPSLAMVGLVLTLSRWLEVPVSAGIVTFAYSVTIASVFFRTANVRSLFETPGQLVFLAIAVGGLLAVLVPMHTRADVRRTT